MDDLRFETPEQIEVQYDLARLGSRFIGALWDTLLLLLLQMMLYFTGALLLSLIERFNLGSYLLNAGVAVLVLLSFLLFWGYYVLFELLWEGQTPGKRLAGVRTVRRDGFPIGFTESAIRNIVRLVDFLPLGYGLGTVVMFMDRRSRRLGDFAAGTLVVHDRRAAQSIAQLRSTAAADARFLEPALPNLHRLSDDEVEAARRFLQRRTTLTNAAPLAAQLAQRFRNRLELDAASPALDDEALLHRIVAQHGRME